MVVDGLDRGQEVMLNNLRLNAHSSRVRSIMEKKPVVCSGCGEEDTAEHILFECPELDGARETVSGLPKWGDMCVLQKSPVELATFCDEIVRLQRLKAEKPAARGNLLMRVLGGLVEWSRGDGGL